MSMLHVAQAVRRRTPIGVDVGAKYIKAAQLSRQGPRWRLTAGALIRRQHPDTPIDREECRRLHNLLARQGFSGREIRLLVPSAHLLASPLELPSMTDQVPFDQVARMEFARSHKVEPDAVEMNWWRVPAPVRSNQLTHVMAVGCRHADVEPLLEPCEAEGLVVTGLDAEVDVLMRLVRRAVLTAEGISTVVDVGWTSTRLIVLYQNVAIYRRCLPEDGLKSLAEGIGECIGLGPDVGDHLVSGYFNNPQDLPAGYRKAIEQQARQFAERLRDELHLSLAYASHRYPDAVVGCVALIGGGAALPGLAELLGESTSMPACVLRTSDLTDDSAVDLPQGAASLMAQASALAAMAGGVT